MIYRIYLNMRSDVRYLISSVNSKYCILRVNLMGSMISEMPRLANTATILAMVMIRSELKHPNGLNYVLFVVSGTRKFFVSSCQIMIFNLQPAILRHKTI